MYGFNNPASLHEQLCCVAFWRPVRRDVIRSWFALKIRALCLSMLAVRGTPRPVWHGTDSGRETGASLMAFTVRQLDRLALLNAWMPLKMADWASWLAGRCGLPVGLSESAATPPEPLTLGEQLTWMHSLPVLIKIALQVLSS